MPPYGVTGGIWQVGPKAWPGITAALLKMVVPARAATRQVPAHPSSAFPYASTPNQTEDPAVAPAVATLYMEGSECLLACCSSRRVLHSMHSNAATATRPNKAMYSLWGPAVLHVGTLSA